MAPVSQSAAPTAGFLDPPRKSRSVDLTSCAQGLPWLRVSTIPFSGFHLEAVS